MARDGLDDTIMKMLEILQERAAETPGLQQYATQIGEALGGNGQRRLGEAILEMLKSLRTLSFEAFDLILSYCMVRCRLTSVRALLRVCCLTSRTTYYKMNCLHYI